MVVEFSVAVSTWQRAPGGRLRQRRETPDVNTARQDTCFDPPGEGHFIFQKTTKHKCSYVKKNITILRRS